MMLARRNFSVALEDPVKHLAAFPSFYIHQAPSRNAPVASSAHLPAKQANNPILHAVIMRLSNLIIALVFESDQRLVHNCGVKQIVQLLIDCHELTSSVSFLITSATARNQSVHHINWSHNLSQNDNRRNKNYGEGHEFHLVSI
jgi:hypothetical protein